MASIEHWNKHLNLLHEFALVEDRLRHERDSTGDDNLRNLLTHILYANFGVYP